mmetsp:Transcript_26707/g.62095  ORF Transcript_26707/g.62095 Transcript_26707/m.62095 type:complete len:89 (+) Transcript_26707:109-375(+)
MINMEGTMMQPEVSYFGLSVVAWCKACQHRADTTVLFCAQTGGEKKNTHQCFCMKFAWDGPHDSWQWRHHKVENWMIAMFLPFRHFLP